MILFLVGNLERSRVGRAWVAIREDEDAAQLMGVPTIRFKLWAFVIGAAIGGLSGALFAGQVGFVNNQKFDVPTSVLFLAAVVLGGSGNKVGVLLGAFVVSYIPDRFTALADYKYLIFGVALIILMIFRPQGLLGARQRLLANGRQAYQRLVGTPRAAASSDSSLVAEQEGDHDEPQPEDDQRRGRHRRRGRPHDPARSALSTPPRSPRPSRRPRDRASRSARPCWRSRN